MNQLFKHFGRFCAFAAIVVVTAAGLQAQPNAGNSPSVLVDGSSTVAPITSAAAEEFAGAAAGAGIEVSVGVSGTGGGFRRFCPGNGAPETDVSDASRAIKGSENDNCKKDGVEFVELPVAFDGLTVAVDHDQQIWPAGAPVCLTKGELKLMWDLANEGTITKWNQVRADLADQVITFTGAAETSGTRDAFKEFLGITDQREDGFFTEDDQLLAQQIGQDPLGITYFGFSFFINNTDIVQAIAIDPRAEVLTSSDQCNGTLPSFETIADSSYPFSRPLFIYVNAKSAERAPVAAFVDFYMSDSIIGNSDFMNDVGYVVLPAETAAASRACWNARKTGTTFDVPGTVAERMAAKGC